MKLYTTKAVAECLGITDRQGRNLRDDGILSEAKPGLFNIKTVVRQYLDFKLGGRDDQANLIARKAEREQIKAELEKMRLEEAQGNFHRTEDVKRALETAFANFKTRMLEIPMKYAGTLTQVTDQGEAFDILRGAVCEALDEISQYDIAFAMEEEEDADGQEK